MLGFFPHRAQQNQDPAQASDALATGQGVLAADTGAEALEEESCPGEAEAWENRGL